MENRMKNMTVLAKIWNAIKLFFGKMYSNPKTATGFTVILCYLLIAVIGPRLFPYDSMVNASNKYLPASWEHPFGTDWMGLDVFRQVLAGTEGVLQVAFYTAVISIFMGTVLGILSGYIGGWVDRVIMVIVNIFLSVPSFPVYLMLAALLTIETPMASSGRVCVMYLGEIVESGKIGDVIAHPRHPYTRALIQAVPIPDPRFKGLGELPLKSMALGSLENRGEGCSFENRCPYSCDNCKKTVAYVTTDTAEVLCSNLEAVPSDPIYKI